MRLGIGFTYLIPKMKTKNCLICKKEFIKNSNNQKYCSDSCSKPIVEKQRNRARKKYRKLHKKRIKKQIKHYYKLHKLEILKKCKIYRNNHKIEIKNLAKKYQLLNKTKVRKMKKKYYSIHKKELLQARKKHLDSDVGFKIACNLRSRVWDVLHRIKKSSSTIRLLDCSIEQLKQHLESQFKPGMTWENYGRGTNNKREWNIDHIIPCASFDLSKESEQRKCFHYTNLQPLWAKENWSKGKNENLPKSIHKKK
jgi:signal recognition particle GTPase